MKAVFTCCLATMSWLAAQTQLGQIAGTISNENGTPVARALVMASLQPPLPLPASFAPFDMTVASEDTGAFALRNLRPGTYRICAEKRDAGMLNPCTWSDAQTTVTVAAAQTVRGVAVQMKQGYLLSIRLDDSGKHLIKSLGRKKAGLLIGATQGTTPFQPATVVGTDNDGEDLTLLIPYDTQVQVSVYSDVFSLLEPANKLTTSSNVKGFSVPVRVPKGQTSKLTIQLTGAKGS